VNNKVLFVDDDSAILGAYQRQLRKLYSIDIALGGEEGLAAIRERGPFAVVIADMQMPRMDGVEFLKHVRKRDPNTVRMMLTGNADQRTAMDAVNHGEIFRFLTKPCAPDMLTQAIEAALRQYQLVVAEKELLEKTLTGSIRVVTEIMSLADPVAYGRAARLRRYAREMVKFLKIEEGWKIELAAMLSQLGQMAIPPEIMVKRQSGKPLTTSEQEMWDRIPQVSNDILTKIPRMDLVAHIILYHHKCYNGGGFPVDAVFKDDIPFESRVLHILDDLTEYEAEGKTKAIAFRLMRGKYGVYDTALLEKIELYYKSAADEVALVSEPATGQGVVSAAPSHIRKQINKQVNELVPGDLLVDNVVLLESTMLLKRGIVLTPIFVETIQNYHKLKGVQEPITVIPGTPNPV